MASKFINYEVTLKLYATIEDKAEDEVELSYKLSDNIYQKLKRADTIDISGMIDDVMIIGSTPEELITLGKAKRKWIEADLVDLSLQAAVRTSVTNAFIGVFVVMSLVFANLFPFKWWHSFFFVIFSLPAFYFGWRDRVFFARCQRTLDHFEQSLYRRL